MPSVEDINLLREIGLEKNSCRLICILLLKSVFLSSTPAESSVYVYFSTSSMIIRWTLMRYKFLMAAGSARPVGELKNGSVSADQTEYSGSTCRTSAVLVFHTA